MGTYIGPSVFNSSVGGDTIPPSQCLTRYGRVTSKGYPALGTCTTLQYHFYNATCPHKCIHESLLVLYQLSNYYGRYRERRIGPRGPQRRAGPQTLGMGRRDKQNPVDRMDKPDNKYWRGGREELHPADRKDEPDCKDGEGEANQTAKARAGDQTRPHGPQRRAGPDTRDGRRARPQHKGQERGPDPTDHEDEPDRKLNRQEGNRTARTANTNMKNEREEPDHWEMLPKDCRKSSFYH